MDYERQQSANLLSFYTDEDMKHKSDILLRLVKAMKDEGVTWALSCSSSYFFRGILDEFDDYDIVVESNSVKKFMEVFEKIGGKAEIGKKNGKESFFSSKFFAYGTIEGVEFDIMSGFTVTTYSMEYCYELEKEQIEYIKGIIPVCPIESSMMLYGMMIEWQAKRRFKYELAKGFLRYNGVRYPDIFKEKKLPKFIQEDIAKLLG